MTRKKNSVAENYNDHNRKGGSIQTFTGEIFYPLDPKVEEINLLDVAHAMGNKARFTGHTKIFYSSAEHAVRVSWFLKNQGQSLMCQFVGLHHDDSDAYLPDVPTPLKILPEFAWFKALEHKIQDMCFEKFGCIVEDYSIVKAADIILLLTEKRELMSKRNSNWNKKFNQEPIPKPYEIIPWLPENAKLIYLAIHKELTNALLSSDQGWINPSP